MSNRVVTEINPSTGKIIIQTHLGNLPTAIMICDTTEANVREGLIKLGWTPPDEKINKN